MNREQNDILIELYSDALGKAYMAEPATEEQLFYELIAKGYGKALDALYVLDGMPEEKVEHLTADELETVKEGANE